MLMNSKIFINDNIPNHSRQRGVSRYFWAIVDGAINEFGANTAICSSIIRDYGQSKHIRSFRPRMRIHDFIASSSALLFRPSIFFSPYYGNAYTKSTEIFTVYDMIYELFQNHFPHEESVQKFILEKKRCMDRSSALLAISHSTANDITSCYPEIDEKKIFVIHLGVSDIFQRSDNKRQNRNHKPYFLYIGRRETYKNFKRLLIAFGLSNLGQDFDLRVVSTGQYTQFSKQESDIITQYDLVGKVHLESDIPDLKLRNYYANSAGLIYPSEYEGFGFPILEAMASGTIVGTSNTSSMPEVGGEVAIYFDPFSEESIAHSLTKIANMSFEERDHWIKMGRLRAKTFSWSRCYKQTSDVFKKFM